MSPRTGVNPYALAFALADVPDDWPRPRPANDTLTSVHEPTAEGVLPCLPRWVSGHIQACQEELRTPLAMNLAVAIGTLAAAISGRVKIRIHSNYTCHTALFVCAVAAPGELKSPAFRLAAAPIKAWEAAQQDAERDSHEQRRMTREHLEAEVEKLSKEWRTGYANDPLAPEATELRKKRLELELLAPAVPLEFLVQDVTPEALSDLLATQGRIACLSSDAAKIFSILGGHYNQNSAPDLGVWLEAYDGEMKTVHRKGKAAVKPQHEQTTLSALLMIQHSVLDNITGNPAMTGQGLVQRMLWVVCESSVQNRWAPGELPRPVPAHVADAWHAGVRRLLDLPSTEVRLSADAHKVYVEQRDALEARLKRDDLRPIADWANKHLERMVRIAAVLWACDGATGEITNDQMRDAAALGWFFVPHAKAAMLGSGPNADEKAVLEWIRNLSVKAGGPSTWVPRRDILRNIIPERLRTAAKLVGPLGSLVARGDVECTEPGDTPERIRGAKFRVALRAD